jgi:AmiR/NasT family two-component response regulator
MRIDSEAFEKSVDSFSADDIPTAREIALLEQLQKALSEIAQLRTALESNRTIGAACGILMAALQLSQSEAFDRLRTASQSSGRKLVAVAADVLFTGALPPADRMPEPAGSD